MPPQFRGLACFSPRVYKFVRILWEIHGGEIASSFEDINRIQWFFAAAEDTYWITRLGLLPIVIYDQMWVVESIETGICVLPDCHILFKSPAKGSILQDAHSLAVQSYLGTVVTNADTSDAEIEDTLVETNDSLAPKEILSDEDPSPMYHKHPPTNPSDMINIDRPSSRLIALLSSTHDTPPLISVAAVIDHTSPVHCSSIFQAGALVDGAMFRAKRYLPMRPNN